MNARSTERGHLKAMFTKAAIALENGEACACCPAMMNQDRLPEGIYSKGKGLFAEYFKPQRGGTFWWNGCSCEYVGNPKTRDPRVLAMCFMAAMVEAGDA